METNTPISAAGPKQRIARIKVVAGGEPRDWSAIYGRLDSSAKGANSLLLNLSAALATFAGLFGTMGLLAATIWRFYPGASPYLMAIFVIPPGFLVGAAAGQAGGNLFLRLRYGLDDATRRGFAARLTLGRAPARWPGALRRWLFSGDWLGTPECDLRVPYIRLFVVGPAPATCGEEDMIWREIHSAISGEGSREAGTNHREISYPGKLPEWARNVESGDGVENLRKRIGDQAANDWVAHLWRRACRQWPALDAGYRLEDIRRDNFELHWLQLSGGREALAVVLRPIVGEVEVDPGKQSSRELAA